MKSNAVELLERLIATPSFSREEDSTATIITDHLTAAGVDVHRLKNNIWAVCRNFDPSRPSLLLNSHHDTVHPVKSYTRDPFEPARLDGRLYGLGSNDAGASVVSLIDTFIELHNKQIGVNLILAITAEEEVSGANGIELLLKHFKETEIDIDMAIVGEPTGMNAAIAERGLMVLDCESHGVSGHAARNEGINAIYQAMADIDRLRTVKFDRHSTTLGEIGISVTQISAGIQHNVVPDSCKFVVDVRTTDAYTNAELAKILTSLVDSDLIPRSTRLNASVIAEGHPLVKAALSLGAKTFVSPTLSDRALMHGIPALKIGPGESSRSHTADEFIYESEIANAIAFYKQLITKL